MLRTSGRALRPLSSFSSSSSSSSSSFAVSPLRVRGLTWCSHTKWLSSEVGTDRTRRALVLSQQVFTQCRAFHVSRPNQGLHVVPLLAGLKSTVVVGGLKTVTRIVLTLLPIMLLHQFKGSRWLRKLDGKEYIWAELGIKKADVVRMKKRAAYLSIILAAFPFVALGLVILASVERTPITGRLRLIVISPDEEEGIIRELRGPRWYRAVSDLLTTEEGPPKFMHRTDWRHAWAERILRQLESVVPALQNRELMRDIWLSRGPEDPPFPPPPNYPLQPRPRASVLLHYVDPPGVDKPDQNKKHTTQVKAPHEALGPPYALLVADSPHQNAFSYGFGEGSGGLVVFSGFFDDILRKTEAVIPPPAQGSTSLFSSLRRALFPPEPPPDPVPTAEQDAQLAILLAHEVSHLLLSHHLETLSSVTYFWPSLLSVVTDIVRAITFPITMIGGPFINDALKNIGEISTREFSTCVDSCSGYKTEVEADLVSIRLLALAGWDPRLAIEYWEARLKDIPEQVRREAAKGPVVPATVMPGSMWDGEANHPVHEARVRKMRQEIERWEREKQLVLKHRKASMAPSS